MDRKNGVATGILCDRGVPIKLKDKFYQTDSRLALPCGSENWTFRKDHSKKIGVAEIRMLRGMSGHTLRDKIQKNNKKTGY